MEIYLKSTSATHTAIPVLGIRSKIVYTHPLRNAMLVS